LAIFRFVINKLFPLFNSNEVLNIINGTPISSSIFNGGGRQTMFNSPISVNDLLSTRKYIYMYSRRKTRIRACRRLDIFKFLPLHSSLFVKIQEHACFIRQLFLVPVFSHISSQTIIKRGGWSTVKNFRLKAKFTLHKSSKAD